MCIKSAEDEPETLEYILDHLKTEEMRKEAVRREPYALPYVPNHFKTQKMCDKAVKYDSSSLQFVPDWFVRTEWVYMWYNDYYDDDGGHWEDDDEDKFFEWYDGYKKRKAQKASIKEELLSIPWHPSRYWDRFMSENEKQEVEICGDECRLVCVW